MGHYIDHPVLYSDTVYSPDWERLQEQATCRSKFWRKYAKRKMRRVVKELLRGVNPRIEHP